MSVASVCEGGGEEGGVLLEESGRQGNSSSPQTSVLSLPLPPNRSPATPRTQSPKGKKRRRGKGKEKKEKEKKAPGSPQPSWCCCLPYGVARCAGLGLSFIQTPSFPAGGWNYTARLPPSRSRRSPASCSASSEQPEPGSSPCCKQSRASLCWLARKSNAASQQRRGGKWALATLAASLAPARQTLSKVTQGDGSHGGKDRGGLFGTRVERGNPREGGVPVSLTRLCALSLCLSLKGAEIDRDQGRWESQQRVLLSHSRQRLRVQERGRRTLPASLSSGEARRADLSIS